MYDVLDATTASQSLN